MESETNVVKLPHMTNIEDVLKALKFPRVDVKAVLFHQAVRNETRLTHDNTVKDRQAVMVICPLGLLFEQKGKKLGLVPNANIIYCDI